MEMYAVTVNNGPTFYLCPSVQGIVDASHALKIARDIIKDDSAIIFVHKVRLWTDDEVKDIWK